MIGPATVATSIAARVLVDALCLSCDHCKRLDLQALADRGLAHVGLPDLPLRCDRCGSRECRVIVSGRAWFERP